jgi:hypothetical protein
MRPQLKKFAERMEEILKVNDDKDGWEGCSVGWLLDQVGKELREARTAYREQYLRTVVQPEAGDAIKALQDEAVDVANFCMMVWDVLEEERQRFSIH